MYEHFLPAIFGVDFQPVSPPIRQGRRETHNLEAIFTDDEQAQPPRHTGIDSLPIEV